MESVTVDPSGSLYSIQKHNYTKTGQKLSDSRFSNRSQMTVTDKESYVTSYEYHPNNWLLKEEKRQGDTVETTRYRYDANGNQVYREWEKVSPEETKTGTMKFVSDEFMEDVATLETREYNGFNQLVSVYRDGENIAYRYRPDGLRYGKTVRGRNGETTATVHLWDGQNIVAEVGANEQVNARYLRGINLIVRELDGKNQYYLFNAHGDVVQRAYGWGNVLKTYRYDAFGNEQNLEKLDSNPFRYCGEYFDKETGTYYLRARNYDPQTGRFTSEDTTHTRKMNIFDLYGDYQDVYIAGGVFRDKEKNQYIVEDPLGLNFYTYCQNNPVLYSDANGNIPLLAITAIAGAVVGGICGGIIAARNGGEWWQGAIKGAAIGGLAGLTLGAAGSLVASSAMGSASLTLTTSQTMAGFSALAQGGTAATLWGVSRDGINQGIRHFYQYATQYPDRLASIASKLGIDVNLTKAGFTTFTNAAMNIVNNYQNLGGLMRQVGDKAMYYYNNVVIIMYNGKLQSVMTASLKYFNKMK